MPWSVGPTTSEPLGLGPRFGGHQFIDAVDLEGDVLNPFRRILVTAHDLLVRQFEEGEHIAPAGVEEDVHVGVVLAGRRHVIFRECGRVLHAEHVAIKLDRLLGVLAAIGDVMNAIGYRHCALSCDAG